MLVTLSGQRVNSHRTSDREHTVRDQNNHSALIATHCHLLVAVKINSN